MHLFLDLITAAGTLTLIVLGLALILGLMDVVNLAHTGFMAVGVYLTVTLWQSGVNIWLAMLLGTLGAALLGAIVEWLVVRRLYGRPLDTILATWGISLMVVQAISWVYGRGSQTLNHPLVARVWFSYSAYRLMLLAITAVFVFVLWLIVRFTEWGLIVRMVMANETLAQGIGPNGAGKSTLLNILTDGRMGHSGSIDLKLSRTVTQKGAAPFRLVRAGLGRKFQTPTLFSALTAAETMILSTRRGKLPSCWRRLKKLPYLHP